MSSPKFRPHSMLYTSVYQLTFTFVHTILTCVAAVFRKQPMSQSSSLGCRRGDLERGDIYPEYTQSQAPASIIRQRSRQAITGDDQDQTQFKRSNSKKNVQFELPKKRACPPLGRIDLFASSPTVPSSDNDGRMRRSLERIRNTAAHPRSHHATYFLD